MYNNYRCCIGRTLEWIRFLLGKTFEKLSVSVLCLKPLWEANMIRTYTYVSSEWIEQLAGSVKMSSGTVKWHNKATLVVILKSMSLFLRKSFSYSSHLFLPLLLQCKTFTLNRKPLHWLLSRNRIYTYMVLFCSWMWLNTAVTTKCSPLRFTANWKACVLRETLQRQ